MTVDAGADADEESAAQCLGLHSCHPILGLALVELDPETLGRIDHPGDCRRVPATLRGRAGPRRLIAVARLHGDAPPHDSTHGFPWPHCTAGREGFRARWPVAWLAVPGACRAPADAIVQLSAASGQESPPRQREVTGCAFRRP